MQDSSHNGEYRNERLESWMRRKPHVQFGGRPMEKGSYCTSPVAYPTARARPGGQSPPRSVLEGANIKLAAVATDVLGKSGRQMIEALVGGAQDAQALAELARGRLRAKLPDLRLALEGRVQPHHRFLLGRILAHIDFLEESIAHVQQEIEQHLAPFEEAVRLAQSVLVHWGRNIPMIRLAMWMPP
jgi:hypothetical protein